MKIEGLTYEELYVIAVALFRFQEVCFDHHKQIINNLFEKLDKIEKENE